MRRLGVVKADWQQWVLGLRLKFLGQIQERLVNQNWGSGVELTETRRKKSA